VRLTLPFVTLVTHYRYYPSSSLFSGVAPMEMTNITHALTTFAYYETTLDAPVSSGSKLSIPT